MVCHFVDVWLSICLFFHWPPLLEWLKTNWTWPFSQGIPSVFPPCFWWRHQEWHGAVQISRHPIDDLDPISFVWCFIYIYSGPRHENKGLLVWLEVIFNLQVSNIFNFSTLLGVDLLTLDLPMMLSRLSPLIPDLLWGSRDMAGSHTCIWSKVVSQAWSVGFSHHFLFRRLCWQRNLSDIIP